MNRTSLMASLVMVAAALGLTVLLGTATALPLPVVLVCAGMLVAPGLLVQGQSTAEVVLFAGFASWAFLADSTVLGSLAEEGSFTSPKLAPYALMVGGLFLSLMIGEFRYKPKHRSLILLILIVGVSVPFAVNGISAYLRFAQFLLPILTATALASRKPLSPLIAAVAACIVHVLVGAVFPVQVNGGFGLERMSGWLQVNTYAFACTIAALLGLKFLLEWKRVALGATLLGLGIYGNFVAISRSSWVALVIGAIVMVLVSLRSVPSRLFALAGGVAVLLALLAAPNEIGPIKNYYERGNAASIGSLTGRTELWDYLVHRLLERPLTGFGPGSLRIGPLAEDVQLHVGFGGQGHNAVLHIAVESGFVAALCWLAFVIAVAASVRRCERTFRLFAAGALAAILVFSITEGGPAGFGLFWAVLLGIAAASGEWGAASRRDRHSPEQRSRSRRDEHDVSSSSELPLTNVG